MIEILVVSECEDCGITIELDFATAWDVELAHPLCENCEAQVVYF